MHQECTIGNNPSFRLSRTHEAAPFPRYLQPRSVETHIQVTTSSQSRHLGSRLPESGTLLWEAVNQTFCIPAASAVRWSASRSQPRGNGTDDGPNRQPDGSDFWLDGQFGAPDEWWNKPDGPRRRPEGSDLGPDGLLHGPDELGIEPVGPTRRPEGPFGGNDVRGNKPSRPKWMARRRRFLTRRPGLRTRRTRSQIGLFEETTGQFRFHIGRPALRTRWTRRWACWTQAAIRLEPALTHFWSGQQYLPLRRNINVFGDINPPHLSGSGLCFQMLQTPIHLDASISKIPSTIMCGEPIDTQYQSLDFVWYQHSSGHYSSFHTQLYLNLPQQRNRCSVSRIQTLLCWLQKQSGNQSPTHYRMFTSGIQEGGNTFGT